MRLYETTYVLYNKKMEDILGKEGSTDVSARVTIDLDQISHVGQWCHGPDSLEIAPDWCMIWMSDQTSIEVNESYEDMTMRWKGEWPCP